MELDAVRLAPKLQVLAVLPCSFYLQGRMGSGTQSPKLQVIKRFELMKVEYVKLELFGLNIDQGERAHNLIFELLEKEGIKDHSFLIREREDLDGDFVPIFSNTNRVED